MLGPTSPRRPHDGDSTRFSHPTRRHLDTNGDSVFDGFDPGTAEAATFPILDEHALGFRLGDDFLVVALP
jgi:hypothetical protein